MKKLFFTVFALLSILLVSCNKNNAQGENARAVDLGLSVKWATCNIGAANPGDFGDYYAWGEVDTKEEYRQDNYLWYNLGETTIEVLKYNDTAGYGNVDLKFTLESSDDVAHVKLGGKWRMPTYVEFSELLSTKLSNKYKWTWEIVGGNPGWQIIYLENNNSIFLPAAALAGRSDATLFYWTSSYAAGDPEHAIVFYADETQAMVGNYGISRFCGLPCRPVTE